MSENQKKIWITGASSGIGKAVAIKFAAEGWKVAVSARRKEILQELEKNENIVSYPLDVTDRSQINSVFKNEGQFKVDFASDRVIGWSNDTGKLNQDYQVIPDNDYYQNLSYTVKSTVEWDKFVNPVNRLVHPAGLKNFADTSIESQVSVGIGTTALTNDLIVLDVLNVLDLEG